MQRYFGLRGKPLNLTIILGLVLPGLCIFAYNQAVAGGALALESFNEQFPRIDTLNTTGAQRHNNSQIQGTVIALYTIGGMFGAMSCIWIGDKLGRRKTIFVACIVQGIGAILMATSYQLAQFIVARLVVGLGTGGVLATVPVWQSELSRTKKRGAHVVTEGVFIGVGLSIAMWINFGFSFVSGSASWRVPFIFQIVFTFIVMFMIVHLPESPRWLVKMNRVEEAREILSLLQESDAHSGKVDEEIRDIQISLEIAGKVSLKQLFTMGPQRIFHRVMIAAIVQMFLQMTGVNSITFYAATIFETNLQLDPVVSRILAAVDQAVIVIGGMVTFYTIERVGRRRLMMFSATGNAINMALMAGLTSQPQNTKAMNAAVFFIFFYNFTYVIGFLGIPFLYATEVAPLHLRAAINGISVATSWAFNFVVAEITPVAFDSIGWKYFIVYACINTMIVPVVYFFFPESSGRSLEEMDEIFLQSKSIFDPVRVAKRLPKKHLAEMVAEQGGMLPKATTEEVEKEANGHAQVQNGDSV